MATPSSGDKFSVIKTTDVKPAAFKLPPASLNGERFVPVISTDAKPTAMKVVPTTVDDENGFPVLTSDGKVIFVKGDLVTNSVWVGNFSTVGGQRCLGGCSFDGVNQYTPLYNADDPAEDGFQDTAFNNIRQPYGWIEYGGDLFVYGQFQNVGGEAVTNIAKWDSINTKWVPVHVDEPNSTVQWAEVIGSDLYIGGAFTTIGATTVNRVAKWNGTSWSALGATGLNSTLKGMVQYDGDLVCGGYFTTAGGSAITYLAKWNGSAWSSVGTQPNAALVGLGIADGNLYAAGNFTSIGGAAAGYCGEWDGAAWDDMDGGFNSAVFASGGVGDYAFFSGSMATMGEDLGSPLTVKKNAYWDGSWHNMSETDGEGYGQKWLQWGESATEVLVFHTSAASVGNVDSQRMALWTETVEFKFLPNQTMTPDAIQGYHYDSENSLHLFGSKYLLGDYLTVDSVIDAVVYDGITFANITRPNPSEFTISSGAHWGFYSNDILYIGILDMYDVVNTVHLINYIWKVDGDSWERIEHDTNVYWKYVLSSYDSQGRWLKIDSETGYTIIPIPVYPDDEAAPSGGVYYFDGTEFGQFDYPNYYNAGGDKTVVIPNQHSRNLYNDKEHFFAPPIFYDDTGTATIIGTVVSFLDDSVEWDGYWNGVSPTDSPRAFFTAIGDLFIYKAGGAGQELQYWDGTDYVYLKNKAGITLPTEGGINCLGQVWDAKAFADTTAIFLNPFGLGASPGVFKIESDSNKVSRLISEACTVANANNYALLTYGGQTIFFNLAHYIVPVENDIEQTPIRANGTFRWDNETDTWSSFNELVFGKTSGEQMVWCSVIQTDIYS